ncbi:MAG: FliA/WhiG family RNA polymerase sigma factor [Phycisphaerae bacterium]|nr:FliA/WhiG family RNA polymerase sigma factor [Phycisphaerae bacterium]
MTKHQVKQWWTSYKRDGSEAARNKLVEHYWPLVRQLATRLRAGLADGVEVDDLVSAGTVGLIEALATFDPFRGVQFGAFCSRRLRGAMLDELRTLDWAPRLVRRRERAVREAVQSIEVQLGRPPVERELAAALHVPVCEVPGYERDAHGARVLPLGACPAGGEEDDDRAVGEADPRSPDPVLVAEGHEIRQVIAAHLGRVERLVLTMYYFEEMTLREIGGALGLSESRVSQIRSALVEQLKERLVRTHPSLAAA